MQQTLRTPALAAACSLLALAFFLPRPAHAATITITIVDNQFTPQSITVNPGDTVTWINRGSLNHTVTADNSLFDSGTLQPGGQFSVTFNQPGTYGYRCSLHPGMTGSIMVGSAAAAPLSIATAPPAALPPSSSAINIAQLTAQVQALLAQISALQAQRGVSGGPSVSYDSSSCPLVGRTLKPGSLGDDVLRLQQFLARDPSVYPEGQATGYYGALTQAAVQRWQAKYNIVSSGDPSTTGYGVVGPRTAAAISLLCTTGQVSGGGPVTGTSPSVPSGTGVVGGFIQVSPISGSAPLNVNVTVTVNTAGGCGGAVYTLSYGDGTAPQQIPVAAGNCSPVSQTYPHRYLYGGVYQITLSAGSHTTSATVTVSGAAGVGSVVPNLNTPTPLGTISAFTNSGNAPLNVTFYVSCTGGTVYNVIFGDGTDLGSTGITSAKCGTGGLDAVSHTYTSAGTFKVQLVVFGMQDNGTVAPTTVASLNVTVKNVADSYSYNPPQLSPGASSLAFTLQFDLPTACTGFDISWGDGSASTVQADGGTSGCAQTGVVTTRSHTYAQAGSYVITLKRGAALSRSDTVAVTVTQ